MIMFSVDVISCLGTLCTERRGEFPPNKPTSPHPVSAKLFKLNAYAQLYFSSPPASEEKPLGENAFMMAMRRSGWLGEDIMTAAEG